MAGVVALLVKAVRTKVQVETYKAGGWLFGPPTLAKGTAGLLGIFLYFAKAGMFLFGSGLAVVPFLYGGVVQEHHWLTDRQFVDAVAVAMITPGPVVIMVAFIGYLVVGNSGATAAALGIFPVYLIVVLLAPSVQTVGQKSPSLNAFVRGVTAAATGAIAGAVIVLARRSVYDVSLDDCDRYAWSPHPLEGAGANLDSVRSSGGSPVTGASEPFATSAPESSSERNAYVPSSCRPRSARRDRGRTVRG